MSHFRKKDGENESSAQEMLSKRLVDYFLVYSCEPQKRKQQETKENQNVDTREEKVFDHSSASAPTSAGENQVLNNANKNKKNAEKVGNIIQALTPERTSDNHTATKSSKVSNNRATRTRAVHLSVASDGGIIGNGGNINEESSRGNLGLLDEVMVTPLVTNRKEFAGDSHYHRQKLKSDIRPNLSNDVSIAATFRSIRIPVTEDADDEFEKSESTESTSLHSEGMMTPKRKHNEKEVDNDDEFMTPSRIRAMDSDEEDHDNNRHVDAGADMEESRLEQSVDVEESENIHLPTTENIEDADDPLAAHFTLLPVKTAQYPPTDHPECPMNPMVSHFCFPQTLSLTTEYRMPRIHYFVLTNDKGKKIYGTCLTVWEEYQLENDDSGLYHDITTYLASKENVSDGGDEQNIEIVLTPNKKPVYIPKVLCIMSSWPYLHSFREYLGQLYRLATMTNLMNVPIERYVLNLCDEAPAPPPGMFELQIKILSSTLKFWAPPAGQPIAYVALPFKVLFECLDLNNIIFVWYALTLERKVLLVSSQFSLLTTCAEILSSLLFPMEWSHLYIPILPLFLSPMLDAPMPYLCGITRQNFSRALDDISDETIIVDLDQNLITTGDNMPAFPPLSLKRRSKLEKVLQLNAGEIFWQARGLSKADILGHTGEVVQSGKLMRTADRVWKEKLRGYDDAFNLAFTPDSEALSNDGHDNDKDLKQSAWDSVQEAFLCFYVSMLRGYSKYIVVRKDSESFETEAFINSQKPDSRYFLRELCSSQQFDCFITKKMYEPNSPDIIFFDQSIAAKKNRSKMTLKKRETAFLISAKAHRKLRTVEVSQPSDKLEQSSNLLDQLYATVGQKKEYMYKSWPDKFDEKKFGSPRPIPSAIAAEFARMDTMSSSFKIGHSEVIDDDLFRPSVTHPSIEVATYTVFYSVYCKVAGSEFEILRNKFNGTLPYRASLLSKIKISVETEMHDSMKQSAVADCATNICSPCSGAVSRNTITSETVAMLNPQEEHHSVIDYDKADINVINSVDAIGEDDVEAAKLVANRQLDLAFSVLETKSLRGLPADQDALRALMEACGRCGSISRATQLITMMKEQYLTVDSDIYSNYLTTFSVANEIDPDEPIKSPLTNVPLRSSFNPSAIKIEPSKKWFKKVKKNKLRNSPLVDTSIHASETSSSNGNKSESSVGNPKKSQRPGSTKKSFHQTSNGLQTNEDIERHITMGECLLKDDVYGGIEIEDKGDNCPQCSAFLSTKELMAGWSPCHFTEYTTKCLHCKNKFIPRFVIKSKSPEFVGTQGAGTPLYCEFFSPWVLRREIFLAMDGGNNVDAILDLNKRSQHDFNTKLWWNMIVHFRKQKLPITFLLDSFFPCTLIL